VVQHREADRRVARPRGHRTVPKIRAHGRYITSQPGCLLVLSPVVVLAVEDEAGELDAGVEAEFAEDLA